MEDLDEHIASVQQAARDARDPTQRQRLNAAAALFAALSRRDERELEAWAIVREVASYPLGDGIDVLRHRSLRLLAEKS